MNVMFCDNLSYKVNLKYYKPVSIDYRYTKLPFKDYKLVKTRNSYYIKTHQKVKTVKDKVKNNNIWSTRTYPFNNLLARYSKQEIKHMIIKNIIVVIPCGKCSKCLNAKKTSYEKRVKAQFKKTRFNYLLTLTFSNEQIRALITDDEKKELINYNDYNISYLSTLSKYDCKNIIKNIKNKLNRYYKRKVKLHYILCGEYGENTKRAHYHILLMLNEPIPDLIKIPAKGNYYKSSMFESKQYGLYDLQLADSKDNTAKYITKYLVKDSNKSNTFKLNLFQEQQQKELISNNIKDGYLYKKPEYLDQDKEFYEVNKNNDNVMVPVLTYQREFIKMSRCLGISNDYYENYANGVLNKYYKNKLKKLFKQFYWFNCTLISYKVPYDVKYMINLYKSYLTLFRYIDIKRIKNIKMYFFKELHIKKIRKKAKYDIF
nr:MAG: replication initiation protein [Microvirus Sku110]